MEVRPDSRGRAQGGAGKTVEHGAVHRLSDGDLATSPTCHCIPGHLSEHRKETGSLGGGESRDAGGRHVTDVRGIPYRHSEGRDGGAPGTRRPGH